MLNIVLLLSSAEKKRKTTVTSRVRNRRTCILNNNIGGVERLQRYCRRRTRFENKNYFYYYEPKLNYLRSCVSLGYIKGIL